MLFACSCGFRWMIQPRSCSVSYCTNFSIIHNYQRDVWYFCLNLFLLVCSSVTEVEQKGHTNVFVDQNCKNRNVYMCVFKISLYKGVKRVIAVIIPKFSKGFKMIEPSLKKWFRVKYLPVLFERSPPVSNFYNSLTLSPLFTLYLMVKPLFSLQKEVKIWNANLQTAVTGRFSRLMDGNYV